MRKIPDGRNWGSPQNRRTHPHGRFREDRAPTKGAAEDAVGIARKAFEADVVGGVIAVDDFGVVALDAARSQLLVGGFDGRAVPRRRAGADRAAGSDDGQSESSPREPNETMN